MILYSEGATKAQEAEAEQILEVLTFAYPNHPWGVRVYDGGFFIRHLDFPSQWGMNCKTKKVYSVSSLKREVILMAGEWLERAGLKRGVGEDAGAYKVEGVPDKFQPPEFKPSLSEMGVVIAADTFEPLRTEPRPQALKENT